MEVSMRDLVREAVDFGFSHAGGLDVATLVPREEVRDMCAADRCGAYGRSWVCPPGCGTLDRNRQVITRFRTGLIVQTTAELEDDFDYDTMMAADALQKKRVAEFRDVLTDDFPALVALGNGACDLCPECTYPDEPCRHPAWAISSMEAFGLVVSEVCAANNLPYYYGPGTITYTGCYLLD